MASIDGQLEVMAKSMASITEDVKVGKADAVQCNRILVMLMGCLVDRVAPQGVSEELKEDVRVAALELRIPNDVLDGQEVHIKDLTAENEVGVEVTQGGRGSEEDGSDEE